MPTQWHSPHSSSNFIQRVISTRGLRELTEGILSDDRLISLEFLGLALLVDGLDAELVRLALLQAGHVGLAVLRRAARDPLSWGTFKILNKWDGNRDM